MTEEGARKAVEELAELRASRETRTEPHEWELELPLMEDDELDATVIVFEKKKN